MHFWQVKEFSSYEKHYEKNMNDFMEKQGHNIVDVKMNTVINEYGDLISTYLIIYKKVT